MGGPHTKIHTDDQVEGHRLDLGGSFGDAQPGIVHLHESVLGANDASLIIDGDVTVKGTIIFPGASAFIQSTPSGAYKKITAMEYDPITGDVRITYET